MRVASDQQVPEYTYRAGKAGARCPRVGSTAARRGGAGHRLCGLHPLHLPSFLPSLPGAPAEHYSSPKPGARGGLGHHRKPGAQAHNTHCAGQVEFRTPPPCGSVLPPPPCPLEAPALLGQWHPTQSNADHPWAAESRLAKDAKAAASRAAACSPTGRGAGFFPSAAGRAATPWEALWLQTELMRKGACGSRGSAPGIRHEWVRGTLGLGEGAWESKLGEEPGHWPSDPKASPRISVYQQAGRGGREG